MKIEKERGQNDTVCICRASSEIAIDNGGLATGKLTPQYAVGNHKTAGHVDGGGRDRDKAGQGAKRFWLLPAAASDPTREIPDMAFVADIKGICSKGVTRRITWQPKNPARISR